jgi:outer membrane protein assembly factor BamB
LKYAANGALSWQRTYGTVPDELNSGAESGIDVAVAPDNSGVVVLGNYRDGNIFLAKFSTEGTVEWDLTWGGNQEGASAIAIAPDGTIYVTGATFDFGVGQADAFLLSFTPTGTLNWQRTVSKNAKPADAFLAAFAGTVTEPAGVVGVTAAVVAIPAGSETFAGSSDAFLLRIQP